MQLFYLFCFLIMISVSSFHHLRSNLTRGYRNFSMSQSAAKSLTENAIKDNKVMVFSKSYCPHCAKTKSTLKSLGIQYGLLELDTMNEGNDIQAQLLSMTNQRTVPNVFVNGKHVGGNDDTHRAIQNGTFQRLMNE